MEAHTRECRLPEPWPRSSAWLMSIFQNHETQESLTPKKTRGHFLQVGSIMAVFSQSSWDHYTRASHDPACGHSRKKGRGFPEP